MYVLSTFHIKQINFCILVLVSSRVGFLYFGNRNEAWTYQQRIKHNIAIKYIYSCSYVETAQYVVRDVLWQILQVENGNKTSLHSFTVDVQNVFDSNHYILY